MNEPRYELQVIRPRPPRDIYQRFPGRLASVAGLAARASATEREVRAAMARAHQEGASLRKLADVATEAGMPVSHTTVAEWLRGEADGS